MKIVPMWEIETTFDTEASLAKDQRGEVVSYIVHNYLVVAESVERAIGSLRKEAVEEGIALSMNALDNTKTRVARMNVISAKRSGTVRIAGEVIHG